MRSFKKQLAKPRLESLDQDKNFSEFYLNKSIIQVSMNMKQINHQKIFLLVEAMNRKAQ
jgi:glutamate formiminotransferase